MKLKEYFNIKKDAILFPLMFIVIFYSIAIWRYTATGNIFYIFNFIYLGTALGLGVFLSSALKKKYAPTGRRIAQVLVGVYMLGFLGFIGKENMQLEGFFMYLFSGVFAGATLHYFIAKIAGTVIFSRGWCAYACWTAMVLDLLPWKENKEGRIRKWGILRYIHFIVSLSLVVILWVSLEDKDALLTRSGTTNNIEMIWLVVGNALYYVVSIILAIVLKDNRAFCKYVCPITAFMKIGARFSLMKIKIDAEKCIDCGKCEKVCPMDIKLLDYKNAGKRVLSTECIQCSTCAYACPTNAIDESFALDFGLKEKLRYKQD